MLRGLLERGLLGTRSRQFDAVRTETVVYAVGDIHGRADLLLPLVDKILQDTIETGAAGDAPAELVFVGDYVDRGPDTNGVLELLGAMTQWTEIQPVFLLGNHELMMLQFLNDPVAGRRWLRFGGYETLVSYDLGRIGDIGDPDELHRIAAGLREALGDHLPFVEDLVPYHTNGNVLFAHAGADPAFGPTEQPIDALVWGTPNFMKSARRDGVWVVHGHTIVDAPMVRQGRISIDTGAYRSGRLTALKVHRGDISFLTQTGPAAEDHYS